MTARMLATLALALGLTVTAGCSGTSDKGDTDADTDAGDDDDDDPTAETGVEGPDYFIPAAVQPTAFFGFDATTSSLVTVTSTYGDIEPTIELRIGNAEWDQANLDLTLTDLYCIVQLPLTDSTFAPWAQATGMYYGVNHTDAVPLTNCTLDAGFEVDPDWTYGYGDGALAAVFGVPGWGVAFGPITPEGETAVANFTYGAIPEGSFFGATFNDPLLMSEQDGQIGLASELDDTLTLTGNFLQATDVSLGNGLVTAFYETLTVYYITFDAP